jgi:hypothetical protein
MCQLVATSGFKQNVGESTDGHNYSLATSADDTILEVEFSGNVKHSSSKKISLGSIVDAVSSFGPSLKRLKKLDLTSMTFRQN